MLVLNEFSLFFPPLMLLERQTFSIVRLMFKLENLQTQDFVSIQRALKEFFNSLFDSNFRASKWQAFKRFSSRSLQRVLLYHVLHFSQINKWRANFLSLVETIQHVCTDPKWVILRLDARFLTGKPISADNLYKLNQLDKLWSQLKDSYGSHLLLM